MKLFPAIDLFNHCAVRLLRGNYSEMTVYSKNPVAVAQSFRESGAEFLHVVDLQGARDGTVANIETIKEIIHNSGLKTEIGGGVRSLQCIETYLNAGAMRVILGTKAIIDEGFVKKAVDAFGGEHIAVGVDVKDGFVAIKGWTELSDRTCLDFCRRMEDTGVQTIICTDVSRDGAMAGTNLTWYKQLSSNLSVNIIASGGVSDLENIRALARLNLYGAILGKALYTGAVDLKQALLCAEGKA